MNVSWSHTVLKVRDLDAMIEFYCDALGFVVSDRGLLGPDHEIAFLSGSPTDHHQIAFESGRDDQPGGSLNHNAFRVDSIDDVKRVHAWVADDDRVGDGMPITHGNAVSVYFADPEGNGIEVFCDTPWHVPQPQVAGWNPASSNDEILASIDERFGGLDGVKAMEDYRAEQAARLADG